MPNWVRNVVLFSGDTANVRKVLKSIRSLDNRDAKDFDFERLVPITEEDMFNRLVYNYYCYVKTGRLPPGETMSEAEVLHDIHEQIIRLDSSEREMLEIGERVKEDVYALHASNWCRYWYIKHWGTKWNALIPVADAERKYLTFRTAWAFPVPIMEKLAILCSENDVTFKGAWADEFPNQNTGMFRMTYDGILLWQNIEDEEFDEDVESKVWQAIWDEEDWDSLDELDYSWLI